MDIFERQLKELTKTKSSTDDKDAISDHCKHVAIKLLRKFKNGTRGSLEVRFLLEDLLHSLPNETPTNGSSSDPYHDLRNFAKLFTSKSGIEIPLKAKPKRPASVDAGSLLNRHKRSRGSEVDDGLAIQQEADNVQLLYDIFNDIQSYTLSGQRVSLRGIVGEAVSSGSATKPSVEPSAVSPEGVSDSDLLALRSSVELLLPPAPRGQSLRDRLDSAFRHLQELHSGPALGRRGSEIYLNLLEETADILGRLCAPIRDEQIKGLKDRIATCREYLSSEGQGFKLDDSLRIAEADLHKLVTDMQGDLRLFTMGITVATTDEAELRSLIRKESMNKEKKLIERLYDKPLQQTKHWLDRIGGTEYPAPLSRTAIARSLVEALFQTQPVMAQIDSSTSENTYSNASPPNVLPPIFHFAAKHLFLAQNRLQAMTILATLSTLVPASLSSPRTKSNLASESHNNGDDKHASWSERVWILLNSEMQDDQGNTTSSEDQQSHVKIANLADEIVCVLSDGRDGSAIVIDEGKIRSSVDRMLRLEDRVFALLHSRLKSAISHAVAVSDEGSPNVVVKGFSVAPLPGEMKITVRHLTGIIDWACECWEIRK